jgi:hypothetical protein
MTIRRRCRRGALEPAQHIEFTLSARTRRTFLFPQPTHLLELRLQISHRLIHKQLLQGPLLNVPRFVFLEMMDILYFPRKDGAFCLLARSVWNDATELVDSFVDIPAPSALDFFLE